MKYLVDTHILLWTLLDSQKLSPQIINAFNTAEEVQISNVSLWEIAIKYRLGKLELGGLKPEDILQAAEDSHFKVVNVDAEIMASYHRLPLRSHKDPFDRLLIWYAIQQNVMLISRDKAFSDYEQDGLLLF